MITNSLITIIYKIFLRTIFIRFGRFKNSSHLPNCSQTSQIGLYEDSINFKQIL